MPALPLFREWLNGRAPTVALLREFLVTLGEEWFRTEHKTATTDIDAGLRRAVAALQNTRGGEVFLGVNPDRTVVGTAVTVDGIRQTLSQNATLAPNDACITDLNPAVAHPMVVEGEGVRAVIVEVLRTGKCALFLDRAGKLQLCYRRGNETLDADAGEVIGWYRRSRKEEVLTTSYRELKALSARIRRLAIVPDFADPPLPFLSRCMSDGTLWSLLNEDELRSVVGGNTGAGQGIVHGFVDAYLSTVRQAKAIFARAQVDMSSASIENALQYAHGNYSLGDYETALDQQVRAFRQWLLAKGILPD
ncbi:MAG TPA: RNA-binding domain-containing protein [Thermoplasmata archaeon]